MAAMKWWARALRDKEAKEGEFMLTLFRRAAHLAKFPDEGPTLASGEQAIKMQTPIWEATIDAIAELCEEASGTRPDLLNVSPESLNKPAPGEPADLPDLIPAYRRFFAIRAAASQRLSKIEK